MDYETTLSVGLPHSGSVLPVPILEEILKPGGFRLLSLLQHEVVDLRGAEQNQLHVEKPAPGRQGRHIDDLQGRVAAAGKAAFDEIGDPLDDHRIPLVGKVDGDRVVGDFAIGCHRLSAEVRE